jgi:hypothetical protein
MMPEGRNKIERRRLAALQRRLGYLETLAARGEENNWDRGEQSALRWALDRIAEAEEADKCSTPTT